jgi:hypothetical protein
MEQARQKSKRWVISTREEMREAAIEVAREASRKVSIFTHDLEPGIYDDPEFLEIIKRLVLSQTYARIRVLIADPSRAVKSGNDFVHLGRRLNTYIEFGIVDTYEPAVARLYGKMFDEIWLASETEMEFRQLGI